VLVTQWRLHFLITPSLETNLVILFCPKLSFFLQELPSVSARFVMASSFTRFLYHTQRRGTVGRTPLGRVISSSQRPLPDNTQQTNIHAPGGIWNHDRSRRAAVDLRLRPRGHWDRPRNKWVICSRNIIRIYIHINNFVINLKLWVNLRLQN
jgi:hypothetical protein